MLYADGNYNRRKQVALDELDVVIERAASRSGKQREVFRIGGASYENLKVLNKHQLGDLDAALDEYVHCLDYCISVPESMISEKLLESGLVLGNGWTRLEVEKRLQTLLKSYEVGYEFVVHYNQLEPFDSHKASSFDALQRLEDA